MSIQGDGYHPAHDPFGRRFDGGYHPEMAAVAGTEILPGYRAILEGIQCDQPETVLSLLWGDTMD